MTENYEDRMRRGGGEAVEEACRFLDGLGPVHDTLRRITARLDALGIPYAVTGGMALLGHGYNQARALYWAESRRERGR